MTAELDGPRVGAASGTAEQLVIFLHRYGANGNDLIGLAQNWASVLPNAGFVAPHAPNPCAQTPTGRQWYPIPTPGNPAQNPDIAAALDALDGFISDECKRAALSEISVALVGFSQGARMALDAGLRRDCAGIVGYSGTTLEAPTPRANSAMPPPVLLCQGDADQVVPIAAMFETLARLSGPVRWHVARALGHGIDSDGLAMGGEFLATVFSDHRPASRRRSRSGGSQTAEPPPQCAPTSRQARRERHESGESPGVGAERRLPTTELFSAVGVALAGRGQGGVPGARQHRFGI